MGKNNKVAAPQTANKTVAETSAVANSKKMPTSSTHKIDTLRKELADCLKHGNDLEDYDLVTISTFILSYFIKLVANNYYKFHDDIYVASLTCIGVNYGDSYLTYYDSEGDPIKTILQQGEYNLPEFDAAVAMMIDDDSDIADRIYEFVFNCEPSGVDADVHTEMLNILEQYLADAWMVKEVKLTFDFGYTKIEVIR